MNKKNTLSKAEKICLIYISLLLTVATTIFATQFLDAENFTIYLIFKIWLFVVAPIALLLVKEKK